MLNPTRYLTVICYLLSLNWCHNDHAVTINDGRHLSGVRGYSSALHRDGRNGWSWLSNWLLDRRTWRSDRCGYRLLDWLSWIGLDWSWLLTRIRVRLLDGWRLAHFAWCNLALRGCASLLGWGSSSSFSSWHWYSPKRLLITGDYRLGLVETLHWSIPYRSFVARQK